MGHVVLLGDSIFDNALYVPGGPAVIDQLRRELPAGWSATLLAVVVSGMSEIFIPGTFVHTSRTTELPTSSHVAMLSHPDAVVDVILDATGH